jgi:hypothetical protein
MTAMRWAQIAPLAFTVLAGACHAPQAPASSPVDISFRLVWTGPADLDLYVKEPGGTEISRHSTHSPTGGVYSGDCNATPETMCANPVETVFWPKRRAPGGAFQYRVRLVNVHGEPLPITFTITILHGTRIVSEEQGSIAQIGKDWGPRDTRWPK